ncbi:MAG: hypothetical protein ACU0AT_04135 [Tranquillimonas sp.]
MTSAQRRAQLGRLSALAGMCRDSDAARLAANEARMRALRHEIEGLRGAQAERARCRALDPSRLSGADIHWSRENDRRIRRMLSRLAALAAERETLLAAARRSFGRSEALETLVKRLPPPGPRR